MHPLDLIKTRLQIQAAPTQGSLASGKLYTINNFKIEKTKGPEDEFKHRIFLQKKYEKYDEDKSV